MIGFRFFIVGFFVCATLISVKSKYGSGSGSCPGFININKIIKRKVPFVGMTG